MSVDKLIENIKSVPILPPVMVGKIAVLYSHSQKCFHIEFLIEYIANNLNLSISGKSGDYRLLGIADNDEAAHELIEELKAGFSFLNFKY